MINCIYIDDEPLAHIVLKKYCEEIPFINLKQTFTSVDLAIEYCKKHSVDLVFLDIQMPIINGIDFCKKYCQNKMIIFVTAYENYAVQGFELNAIDYLLKPIDLNRFTKSVNKALDYFEYFKQKSQEVRNKFFFVRSQYSLIKIDLEEIDFIETLDDYLKINLAGQKPVITKMNMKNVMNLLDKNQFLRVHRSYIINLKKIDSIKGKTIKMGDVEIPIGNSYEKEVGNYFKKKGK